MTTRWARYVNSSPSASGPYVWPGNQQKPAIFKTAGFRFPFSVDRARSFSAFNRDVVFIKNHPAQIGPLLDFAALEAAMDLAPIAPGLFDNPSMFSPHQFPGLVALPKPLCLLPINNPTYFGLGLDPTAWSSPASFVLYVRENFGNTVQVTLSITLLYTTLEQLFTLFRLLFRKFKAVSNCSPLGFSVTYSKGLVSTLGQARVLPVVGSISPLGPYGTDLLDLSPVLDNSGDRMFFYIMPREYQENNWSTFVLVPPTSEHPDTFTSTDILHPRGFEYNSQNFWV